jgi:pimeloyl-ACP methyl ester carboxylesterase
LDCILVKVEMQMLFVLVGLLPVSFVVGAPAAWIGGHYCTVYNHEAPYVLVLFHGYLNDAVNYYPLGLSFAAAGYAVVIPRDNNDIDAVTKAADWGTSVAGAVRDWAAGRKVAIVGHSMGGSAAMAAAKFTPGLAAFVAMHPAPMLSGSSWIKANGPILFTTGTTDDGNIAGATLPKTALDSYNAALPPKALVNVQGDSHGSSQSLSGMQWSTVMYWLGCFVKGTGSDCSWIETTMCQDKTLAWCYHTGVQAGSGGIHV